jgi:hypothetical protein
LPGVLDFKIKHTYHIVTYDEDLSDEKLTLFSLKMNMFGWLMGNIIPGDLFK